MTSSVNHKKYSRAFFTIYIKISVIQAILFITQCKRPKVKDKPASHKETPKLFRLRERS
ncbi:hypothetical protein HMPREF1395_00270 [Helicobacter pylori GAM112Ai]|nr:hypothetical protein HMPREF1395_00270 [Helicobacter pylori GAM112Ai]EMH32941.1 hypothetical protein HMPREF1424_00849 [Helicobacter pylori GAM42Ai]